jgi:hypothetical protein
VSQVRIISADSAAAILDEKFMPTKLISSVAVLVEEPYREAHIRLVDNVIIDVETVLDVIVHEAELCQNLLETVEADVVHLDTTLGGVPIDELSPVELSNLRISAKARTNLLKILPKLRRIAGEIRRKHNIETLAIGKESMPVRVAELTAGSEAVLYGCSLAIKERHAILVGLPTKCQHLVANQKIYLCSLIESEHDVRGYSEDKEKALEKVSLFEMYNPVARGFRAIKIEPKYTDSNFYRNSSNDKGF